MAASTTDRTPLRAMYLQTHDVARQLKPSKDGVVAHALHETLHFALDGEVEDWGIQQVSNRAGCAESSPASSSAKGSSPLPNNATLTVPSSSEGQGTDTELEGSEARTGFFPSDNPQRPFISYAWDARNQILSLPSPAVAENPTKLDPCSPENRNAFDVTAKFFYLSPPGNKGRQANGETSNGDQSEEQYPVEWIEDAMKRLTISTGLITLDTLVLAFPVLNLTQDTEVGMNGDERGERDTESVEARLEHVRVVWSALSENPQIGSLGLSDISLPNLQAFLSKLSPPPPAPPTTAAKTASTSLLYGEPSANRRPRIVQMNLAENPCRFDKEFRTWADQEGITVVAHNDQKDILPEHTLPGLFSEFTDDLPHPLPKDSVLQARWVLKYSVLIEARGVIADQGYIVYAEAVPMRAQDLQQ